MYFKIFSFLNFLYSDFFFLLSKSICNHSFIFHKLDNHFQSKVFSNESNILHTIKSFFILNISKSFFCISKLSVIKKTSEFFIFNELK
ncbi:hypothetical protein HOF65_03045 [bacterium]|nr:hypothetical protein [bacterium]MBT3852972.1 hypothetical protein [bacterium]MBT4633247.1 hypothetical protein [bacterium]MBT6779005.1 hypothetical protein [bacterium]